MKRNKSSVVFMILMIAMPSLAFSQSSADERIANLERVVAELLTRIAALEVQLGQARSQRSLGSPGNSKDIQNWRQLRNDMVEGDVERLLGSPTKIDSGRYRLTWYYGYPVGGRVDFDPVSRAVIEWEEP